ncbi:hypothetical protein GCM10009802_59200 [Streptomyces synnematoformans]|uniref:DUF2637 domain-containing protein n=1 Tax=Streptomyces synnematoformans TaxID=415721 RepID=A0ABN1ZQI5_9ACTN
MKNFLAWAALLSALVSTASAEWSLAVAAGFHPLLAVAVPASLDAYALAAFRAGRDLPGVVAALLLVNSVSHLVASGHLSVGVPVVIGVSAVAPVVLLRVHLLQGAIQKTPQEPSGHSPVSGPAEGSAAPEKAIQRVPDPMPAAAAPSVTTIVDTAYAIPVHPTASRADSADELLDRARLLDAATRERTGRPASIALLRRELQIGQPRAQAIRDLLRGD